MQLLRYSDSDRVHHMAIKIKDSVNIFKLPMANKLGDHCG